MSAGGAGGRRRLIRTFRSVADADIAGGEVDDCRRDEKRRNLTWATFEHVAVLALNDVESADSGADVDADPFLVLGGHFQAGFGHSLGGSSQGKVNESPHLPRFLLVDELERIEVLDFGGEGDR